MVTILSGVGLLLVTLALGRRKQEVEQYQQRIDNEKKLLAVKQQELEKMQKQEDRKSVV